MSKVDRRLSTPSTLTEAMSCWQTTFEASTDLLQLLDGLYDDSSGEPAVQEIIPESAPSLGLHTYVTSIREGLEQLGVQSHTAGVIDSLFVDRWNARAVEVQGEFGRSWRSLTSARMETPDDFMAAEAVRQVYRRGFADSVLRTSQAIFVHVRQTHAVKDGAQFDGGMLSILGAAWQRTQRPNVGDCKQLASATGLSTNQIKQWVRFVTLWKPC